MSLLVSPCLAIRVISRFAQNLRPGDNAHVVVEDVGELVANVDSDLIGKEVADKRDGPQPVDQYLALSLL